MTLSYRSAFCDRAGAPAAPAVSALAQALSDSDGNVWRYAIEALGKIGAPAVPVLATALSDSNNNVRRYAVNALNSIGAPALPTLKSVVGPFANYPADLKEYVREILRYRR